MLLRPTVLRLTLTLLAGVVGFVAPASAAASVRKRPHAGRLRHVRHAKPTLHARSSVSRAHEPAGTVHTATLCRVRRLRPSDAALPAGARGPANADSVEKASLEIPDLKSPDNAATVEQALKQVKGVKNAIVDFNTRLAVVDYDPSLTELPHFLDACRGAGFEANEYRVELRFPKPIKLKGG